MGKRTAVIELDGQSYTVHAFNIGELEQMVEQKSAWAAVKIALARAEPPVPAEQFDQLEPTIAELNVAAQKLMELAGLSPLQMPGQGAAP